MIIPCQNNQGLYSNLESAIVSCLTALESFIHLYFQKYNQLFGENPRYYPQEEDSPCIIKGENINADKAVLWQMIKRHHRGNFNNVEQALNIRLWPEINDCYGALFAAPLLFDADFGHGELTQVWNEQDFDYLQQNIIGHLMMKQKLKQPLTWFIGLIDDSDKMLTVNNDDGSVWTEIPGELQGQKLADNLTDFFDLLKPKVAPAVKHQDLPMPHIDHPGIFARMKIMWQNLTGKK